MTMARFNKATPDYQPVNQPIVSKPDPAARTGNNAPGFTRDAKGELFLLAVSNFVSQDMHYESGIARDARFHHLVHEVAVADPAWMGRFLPWLRNEANMRTASLVGAIEAAAAMAGAKIPGGRQLVNSVLMRADEPGEALGYWISTHGRKIIKPVKRGIADAVARLYNEYNTLKYDTASHAVRFGDVLELTHPSPSDFGQDVLFKHLIDRRHGREGIPSSLAMIHLNAKIREQAARQDCRALYNTVVLRAAGMTWEDALSLAGPIAVKKDLWEALIPTMGYMALLRNLRNFDEAGIGAQAVEQVKYRLTSAEQVARSRQLPMRFLNAYRAVSSVRWHEPLEIAMNASLANIPQFKGSTLILIDTSGSMGSPFTTHQGRGRPDGSQFESLKLWDAAAMFGLALAQRCERADVVSFSNACQVFPVQRGASLLVMLEVFRRNYFQGGGTATEMAIRTQYDKHDLVVILTDEQANAHGYQDVAHSVPRHIPVITFNLAGYRVGHAPSGIPTRITIGGLTDQAFKLLPVLERRAAGQWPF